MPNSPNIKDLDRLYKDQHKRRSKRKWSRWLLRLGFIFSFSLLFLYALIRNEKVQNYIIVKVKEDLSQRLDTKVDIGRFRLGLLDQLVFEDFYVEDTTGDTLLYSKILKANLNTNLINLIQKKIIVEDILLQDANIKLRRDTANFAHNIELLIAKLGEGTETKVNNNQQKKDKKAFELELDYLYLRNVHFFKRDLMRGEDMTIVVKEGDIQVDKLDFANKHIAVKQADIWDLKMDVIQYQRDEAYFDYWYNYVEPIDSTEASHSSSKQDSIPPKFIYTIEEFNLSDAAFVFDDNRNEPIKDTPDNILDYQHLSVIDICGTVRDFKFDNRVFSGDLNALAFQEESGFKLDDLSADSVTVSPRKLELFDVSLITEQSSIGDTLVFKYKTYEDFMEFKDKVRMDIRFHESTIAVSDITTFIPKLKDITFFRENEGELLQVDGRFTGKINNLNGKKLNLRLGDDTIVKGSFNSRDLAVRNEESMNLNLKQFRSTIPALKELIPGLKLPDNFNKLGVIDFSGRFDGFFIDFVAYGELTTALGKSRMDMQMKFNDNRSNASYSGKLALIDFDLAEWSGDKRFGRVTFKSQVKNGVGLTLETVDTDLSATIEAFPFQGYTYRNLTMEGSFRQNYFNGIFNIKDKNIDLGFTGAIDFEHEIPIYDFDAKVNKLDLKTLQLSKQDFVFAGDFDLNLQGTNLSDMEGEASVGHLSFIHNDSNYYEIDTIYIESTIDILDEKHFLVNSDVLDLKVDGTFDIQKVPNVFKDYFIDKYPRYARKFDINKSENDFVHNEFDYYLNLKNSKNLTELIDPKLDTLKDIVFQGYLDNYRDSLSLDLEVGELRYDQLFFKDVVLIGEANAAYSYYDVGVLKTTHKGKTNFEATSLLATIDQDTISFGLNSQDFINGLNNVNINGQLFLTNDDLFQVSFLPSNLTIMDEAWDISEDNYVRFGKNKINTKNFVLTNKDKKITLSSEGEKGLGLQVENFNLSYINTIWAYDKLQFDAPFSIKASAKDIFKLEGLTAEIVTDTFRVNQDDWGVLQINANMANLKDKAQAYISITKDERQLLGEGFYVPPKSRIIQNKKVLPPHYFDFDFDIIEYPLDILEYFIPTGISETVGTFESDVQLFGVPSMPNIAGELRIFDAALNIDYLGTRYFIDKQKAKLSNTLFDGTGAILKDRFGNEATVFGGIAHDNLKNLRLDARLETDRFLALETEKEDNPIFYGTALGSGVITFTGPFKAANISATATTGAGTKIVIPVSYEQDGSEVSFIKFIDKNKRDSLQLNNPYEIRGLNLDLNITMTELAETLLVFDERAGDVLQGFGNGNIQMKVSRTGDFKMYGNYVVERGEYLFTYKVPNIDVAVINKPFTVKRGGTIRWSGDPLDAQIDLDAEYKGINASPYNLISDFVEALPNDQIKLEAQKNTKVDLELLLKGRLEQPDITFNIDFPELQGQINNYTQNKLRLLQQDQLELNRQVFGLIVIGGFLPTGEGALGNQTGVLINNTVSQVISNQLSIYLTEFIRESITDGGAISGIDFDVNYSEFIYDTNIDNINRGKELSVRPRIYFLNDRVTLDIGFGIGLEDNINLPGTSRLNSQDVIFEFAISEDRRLKIRAYNRFEQTIAGNGLNKTGVGLSYRREFDTFKEFFRGLKKKKK